MVHGGHVWTVVARVLTGEFRSVAVFSGGRVVRATVHGRLRKRDRSNSVVVTVGKPNYAERAFLKKNPKARLRALPVKK